MAVYYTADEIVKGDYLFVSYKHDDKDTVFGIVDLLIDMGVRIWCDTDLMVGDNWNDRVQKIIVHENCKGVIFFNSIKAFLSKPIAKERALITEKIERLSTNGRSFPVLPVNIGKTSTMRLLKCVFEQLPDNDSEIDLKLPLESLNNIIDLFNNKMLYLFADGENAQQCAESLFAVIERSIPSAIDQGLIKVKKLVNQLGSSGTGGLPKVTLGRYKDTPTDMLPSYLLDENRILTYRNEQYIIDSNQAFTVAPLNWISIYNSQEELVLVSDKILEQKTGGPELIKWLNTEFKKYAFNDEELSYLTCDITLVKEQDIEKASSKDFMRAGTDKRITDGQWWIDAYGMGVMQKIVRDDGSVYNNGYNSRIKKCGVRPLIRVNVNSVAQLFNK